MDKFTKGRDAAAVATMAVFTGMALLVMMGAFTFYPTVGSKCSVLTSEVTAEVRYPAEGSVPAWESPMHGLSVRTWVALADPASPWRKGVARFDTWFSATDPLSDENIVHPPGAVVACRWRGLLEIVDVTREGHANAIPGAARLVNNTHATVFIVLLSILLGMPMLLFHKPRTADIDQCAVQCSLLILALAALVFSAANFCLITLVWEKVDTCHVVATRPSTSSSGLPSLRIWAVSDGGGAEFEYLAGLDSDAEAMATSLAAESEVMCLTAAWGEQPTRIFVQRYTGSGVGLEAANWGAYRTLVDVFAVVYLLIAFAFMGAMVFLRRRFAEAKTNKYAEPQLVE